MAKFNFKKPNMQIVWTEIVLLALWLFFGDKIIKVVSELVGVATATNLSGTVSSTTLCTNPSIFSDAYNILGLGYTCSTLGGVGNAYYTVRTANSGNGLLGVVALVMVVMVLTNFISYK